MWNLEGMRVTGKYLSDDIVTGVVELSRVAYGGGVVHTVVLDKPIQFRWRKEPSDRLIIKHSEILSVKDN